MLRVTSNNRLTRMNIILIFNTQNYIQKNIFKATTNIQMHVLSSVYKISEYYHQQCLNKIIESVCLQYRIANRFDKATSNNTEKCCNEFRAQ